MEFNGLLTLQLDVDISDQTALLYHIKKNDMQGKLNTSDMRSNNFRYRNI